MKPYVPEEPWRDPSNRRLYEHGHGIWYIVSDTARNRTHNLLRPKCVPIPLSHNLTSVSQINHHNTKPHSQTVFILCKIYYLINVIFISDSARRRSCSLSTEYLDMWVSGLHASGMPETWKPPLRYNAKLNFTFFSPVAASVHKWICVNSIWLWTSWPHSQLHLRVFFLNVFQDCLLATRCSSEGDCVALMLSCLTPSPLASLYQFYCLVNRDTRASVVCSELLVWKLVDSGIEPTTLRSTDRNPNHTSICPVLKEMIRFGDFTCTWGNMF